MAIGTTLAIALGLAGAGAQVASAKIASKASKAAAKTQTQAATQAADYSRENFDKALAFERERLGLERQQYEQARTDQAPYRAIGGQALGALGGLLGFNGPRGGTLTPPAGVGSPGPLVTMIAPTGQTKQVPAHLVAGYEARGARVVR